MKYFLTLILFIWSGLALANPAFVGTWAWAGFQCRNSNLESNSARSVVWEVPEINLNPASARIVMESDRNASFTYCCDEENNTRRETGSWSVEDETHVQMGDSKGGFRGWLIDGDIVIYSDNNGEEMANPNCNGEKFVLIFSRVDQ